MMYPILILILSFLLDGIVSHYVNLSFSSISLFTTVYSCIALVSVQYFFTDSKKYYLCCFILGLLFDIVYTSTFILNAFTFTLIGMVSRRLYNHLTYNFINNIFISYIGIFIYYVFTNFILVIVEYLNFNIKLIFDILWHSIIMSIIYSLVLYFINSMVIKRKANVIRAIK